MKESYIVDAIRTPVGKFGGSLSQIRTDDLAAIPIQKIIERNPSVAAEEIEDVLLGCANQSGEDNRNVARMAVLLAGLPSSVPGETVNRLCSSGMAAVINADRAIKLGDGDVYIAGGVENMTRSPYVMSKSSTAFGRDAKLYDTTLGWRFINPKMEQLYGADSMGETAENLFEKYNISREDQDNFALWSQTKASQAQKSGRLAVEITTVEIPLKRNETISFSDDEFIRHDTTIESLAKLKPAFRQGGTVTAGNSSGLNDGAAALLLASDSAVSKFGLSPKARIVSSAVAGVEPKIMGIGPVEAANKALKRAGLTWDDIDIIELNEAFAVQALACLRQWGLDDNDARVNPNGGAIAIGHPLGMSGARLLTTALYELHQTGKKYALCTMCVGVGQGYASIIERI